jgi:hypothetical protein
MLLLTHFKESSCWGGGEVCKEYVNRTFPRQSERYSVVGAIPKDLCARGNVSYYLQYQAIIKIQQHFDLLGVVMHVDAWISPIGSEKREMGKLQVLEILILDERYKKSSATLLVEMCL